MQKRFSKPLTDDFIFNGQEPEGGGREGEEYSNRINMDKLPVALVS